MDSRRGTYLLLRALALTAAGLAILWPLPLQAGLSPTLRYEEFTPTATATSIDTAPPLATGTGASTATATAAAVATGTATGTALPTPMARQTASPSATMTPTATPASTVTPTATATQTATNTPSATAAPTTAAAPTAGALVSLVPSVQHASAGQGFTVEVVIDSTVPSRGAQVGLVFDPARLRCEGWRQGTFYSGWTDANGASSLVLPTPRLDNATGSVSVSGVAIMGGPAQGGPAGRGSLFIFSFSSLADGVSPLEVIGMVRVVVAGVDGRSIPVLSASGGSWAAPAGPAGGAGTASAGQSHFTVAIAGDDELLGIVRGAKAPFEAAYPDTTLVINGYYNRFGAVAYADLWAHGHNSAYPSFANDCANFTSQVLHEGGYPLRPDRAWDQLDVNNIFQWWYQALPLGLWRNSHTWSVSGDFNIYATQYPQEFGYVDSVDKLAPGDMIMMHMVDGDYYHMRAIVGYGWTSTDQADYMDANGNQDTVPPSTYTLLADQHNIDRRHVAWDYGFTNHDGSQAVDGYWRIHVQW